MHRSLLAILPAVLLAGLSCTKDAATAAAAPGTAGAGGSLARFTVMGNYLYAVDNENLNVFSLADPTRPVLKKTMNVGFEIETIYPFKEKLFIGSTSVIHIFSIDDPENPQKLSTAISPNVMRRCDPVVAKDTVAYATLRVNGPCGGMESQLVSFNIKDVTNPVQTSSIFVLEPYGLGYADTVLYVCERNSLLIADISNPYNPQFVGQLAGDWYLDVIPYQNRLICWVSDGLIIYDISNLQSPQLIAKIS